MVHEQKAQSGVSGLNYNTALPVINTAAQRRLNLMFDCTYESLI